MQDLSRYEDDRPLFWVIGRVKVCEHLKLPILSTGGMVQSE